MPVPNKNMRLRHGKSNCVYQLRVTLRDVHPPIQRVLHVSGDSTLHKLHWTLQLAMGWTNSHLHQFIVGNDRYSQPEFDDGGELEIEDERAVRVCDVIWRTDAVFAYEYDFGDSWEHDIVVEAIFPRPKGKRYPLCIHGERACPPEDCGGAGGFEEMLRAIDDPDHEEHESYLTWLGGPFDPTAFHLVETNQRLRRLWRRASLDSRG